ncbi:MAG: hypothetical protein QXI07_00090 [Pyrobaculum sp.]
MMEDEALPEIRRMMLPNDLHWTIPIILSPPRPPKDVGIGYDVFNV